MSRYSALFEQLASQQQGAFVPFVTLGDPSPELSLQIIDALIAGGADALELGFPFSDPVADGPTIQDANTRALSAGTTPDTCFEILKSVRQRYPQLPIGLLVYANLVYAKGIDGFYAKAAEVGVDSILVADVPVEMCDPYRQAAQQHGIAAIFIAPPNGDDATLQQVAELGNGYTYLLSRAGVTGTESRAGKPVAHLLQTLKAFKAPPCLLGFGISEPTQVKEAITAGADGVISGSAVVKIIAEHQSEPEAMLRALRDFVSQMKAATRK